MLGTTNGNDVSSVAVGTNGYLYLIGGAQFVLDYITEKKSVPDRAFQRFASNLENRTAIASSIGAEYIHCVCPDKHSVIPEYFPFDIKINLADEFQKQCHVPFMYPVTELRMCEDSFGYLKTDTHWNFSGRLAVTHALMGRLGVDASTLNSNSESLMSLKKSHSKYCGDLGNKINPHHFEVAELSLNDKENGGLRMFSNNISGNNGLINVIFNLGSLNGNRLLIFGDSFILHCLQMLAVFFKETFFLRTPFFHQEIAESFQPTHIITANAERYLPNCTLDADAPLGLLMAGLASKDWNCDLQAYAAINAALQPKGPHNRNFWSMIRLSQ